MTEKEKFESFLAEDGLIKINQMNGKNLPDPDESRFMKYLRAFACGRCTVAKPYDYFF